MNGKLDNISFEDVWRLLGHLGHIVVPDGEEHRKTKSSGGYRIPEAHHTPRWATNPPERALEEQEYYLEEEYEEQGEEYDEEGSYYQEDEEEEDQWLGEDDQEPGTAGVHLWSDDTNR